MTQTNLFLNEHKDYLLQIKIMTNIKPIKLICLKQFITNYDQLIPNAMS